MERYCTKEGANDEKVKFSLQTTSILENTVCKTATKQGLAVLLTLQNASGEPSFGSDKILSKTKQWVGVFPSRIYARAFHRILLFLLSQVSQLSHRPLLFSHQPRCFTTSKTTRRSKRNNTSLFQNDTLFEVKRHVTFHKTTRRFMWNECLFSWCVDSFFEDIRIFSRLYSDKNRRFP